MCIKALTFTPETLMQSGRLVIEVKIDARFMQQPVVCDVGNKDATLGTVVAHSKIVKL